MGIQHQFSIIRAREVAREASQAGQAVVDVLDIISHLPVTVQEAAVRRLIIVFSRLLEGGGTDLSVSDQDIFSELSEVLEYDYRDPALLAAKAIRVIEDLRSELLEAGELLDQIESEGGAW